MVQESTPRHGAQLRNVIIGTTGNNAMPWGLPVAPAGSRRGLWIPASAGMTGQGGKGKVAADLHPPSRARALRSERHFRKHRRANQRLLVLNTPPGFLRRQESIQGVIFGNIGGPSESGLWFWVLDNSWGGGTRPWSGVQAGKPSVPSVR